MDVIRNYYLIVTSIILLLLFDLTFAEAGKLDGSEKTLDALKSDKPTTERTQQHVSEKGQTDAETLAHLRKKHLNCMRQKKHFLCRNYQNSSVVHRVRYACRQYEHRLYRWKLCTSKIVMALL